ncbi:MAG: DUF4363 family protein [Firmicutes bacterium]|nr:DUF4363 family protein [Bacillota bacterium]
MKWLILTAAALLLLLILCLMVWCYLTDSAEAVCQELTRLEQALAREDWEQADAACRTAGSRWQELRPRWALLIDQRELEDIDLGLLELSSALRRREREEARLAGEKLRFCLLRAPKAERPGWENIL